MSLFAHEARPRWWQWPTILSMDAPLVAFVWQEELARAGMVGLRWHHRALLAVVVWLIYVADRWIEGGRLESSQVMTHRHGFYMRYRRPVAGAVIPVMLAALALAIWRLDVREWTAGLMVAGAVAAYLFSHQHLHRDSPWRAPKETCVGGLFAIGCALSPALVPGAHQAAISGLAILFALLCFTNCALISAWEREVDRSHGQTSLALSFDQTRGLCRHLAWLVALGGLAAAISPVVGPAREGAVCAAAAGALLASIDAVESRIGREAARVLADVALLTPPLAWLVAGGG